MEKKEYEINKMLSIKLFNLLKFEFNNVLNSLKDIDQINEIEAFIKDYLLYAYQITNEKLSKQQVIDITKDSVVPITEFAFPSLNKDDHLHSFQYTVTTSLLTILLLYKKGYLPDMGHNPLNFIRNILKSLLPIEEKYHDWGSKSMDFEIRELLNNIEPKIWYKINQKPFSEITLFYWSSFDNEKILKELNLQSIIYETEKTFLKDDKLRTHLKLDPKKTEGYNDFFKLLDNELQNKFKRPDIFFLDTTLIAEYKNKGIIFPFASICKEERYKNFYKEETIFEIGKTLNGVLDSFPISRNFHIPAKSQQSNIKIKPEECTNIKIFSKHLDEKIINWLDRTFSNNEERTFQNNLFNSLVDFSNPTYNKYLDLVSNIFDDDFIPMQLARGAHVSYTLFAYLANCSNKQSSLIDTKHRKDGENNIEINLYKKVLIKERFDFFFTLIFTYVPVISLTLDHIYSGFLRDKSEVNWFDLCLPIEAAKFQDSKISFSKSPLLTETGSPLSCIGGYTLSISHDCDNPHNAAEIIKAISKKYFKNPLGYVEEGFSLANLKDMNCRLIPTYESEKEIEDSPNYKAFIELYIKLPDNLAKRPNFIGWKTIENIISDVTRLHVLILFIFRQYLHAKEGSITNKDEVTKENIIFYINNFKSLIEEYYQNTFHDADKEKYMGIYLRKWIGNNFDNFITEELYMKEIVNQLIKVFRKEHDLAKCISQLSTRTSEVLYSKIKSFCDFNNYIFNDVS